jgi:hypothetical protein
MLIIMPQARHSEELLGAVGRNHARAQHQPDGQEREEMATEVESEVAGHVSGFYRQLCASSLRIAPRFKEIPVFLVCPRSNH